MIDAPAGMRGVVQFRDWHVVPWDSRSTRGVVGAITFHAAKDALGAEVTNRESNWFLEVRGRTCVYYVPGCQVLGVTQLGQGYECHNVDFSFVP